LAFGPGENGVGVFGPGEGLAAVVPAVDVGADGALEGLDGVEGASSDRLFGDDPEEDATMFSQEPGAWPGLELAACTPPATSAVDAGTGPWPILHSRLDDVERQMAAQAQLEVHGIQILV